ncbi:MAG: hypothetical protein ABII71_05830 [Candidatus Micrarchaeota archaeon]
MAKQISPEVKGRAMEMELQNPFRRGRLLPLREARQIAKVHPQLLVSRVSDYNSPRDGFPEEYPGKRPAASYMYLKRPGEEPMVHIMAFEGNDPYSARILLDGRFVKVSKILREMGAEPMQEHFLLIGYGSNPCPGQVRAKIDQGRQLGVEGIKDVMLVFRGLVHGYVPVTESFFEAGYPYAGILRDSRTINAKAEVWGTLLTPPMLKAINISEKVVDPKDPTKSDKDAQYAVADGYPFQPDGLTKAMVPPRLLGNELEFEPDSMDGYDPLLVNTAGYTGIANIYTPTITLPSREEYTGPVAFDTIPTIDCPFPVTNVPSVFGMVLANMAREDSRFELDRLLQERGIGVAEIVRLTHKSIASGVEAGDEVKALALMRWMNARWKIIENRERPYTDMGLTSAIRAHMGQGKNSLSRDMVAEKLKDGTVFSREEADLPQRVRFGNIL